MTVSVAFSRIVNDFIRNVSFVSFGWFAIRGTKWCSLAQCETVSPESLNFLASLILTCTMTVHYEGIASKFDVYEKQWTKITRFSSVSCMQEYEDEK